MIVLVSGGRYYADRDHVYSVLDRINRNGIDLLVHGACHLGGADILAEDWAKDREIEYWGMPAKFKTTGKRSAGPRRNKRMLEVSLPDLVVIFPGGSGTANLRKYAEQMGVRIIDESDYPNRGERS